jgi:hypothetical protein
MMIALAAAAAWCPSTSFAEDPAGEKPAAPPITIKLEGIRLSRTKGSLRLVNLRAEKATPQLDGSRVEMENATAQLVTPEEPDREVFVTAPKVTAFLGASREPAATAGSGKVPGHVIANPEANRGGGDFLMAADATSPVVVKMEKGGLLETDLLLWSEQDQQLFGLGKVSQQATTPDGEAIALATRAFAVDRHLQQWNYLALPGAPVTMTITPSAKPDTKKEPPK